MIFADKIYFKFGSNKLYSGFEFKADRGEKVALTGKSGYGKTTFLLMLCGMIKPDKGTIYINDIAMSGSHVAENRKKIAMLPQNVSSLGSGTVMETIMMPFAFDTNKSKTPSDDIIRDEMGKLDLPFAYSEKTFQELSGGEKQRVGLIICKLLSKPILLLDEPSSAMDRDLIAKAADYILKDPSQTVISVTHDRSWMDACTRVVEFSNARG